MMHAPAQIDLIDELLRLALPRIRAATEHDGLPWEGWVYLVRQARGDHRLHVELLQWEIALYLSRLGPSSIRAAFAMAPPAAGTLRVLVVPAWGDIAAAVFDLRGTDRQRTEIA